MTIRLLILNIRHGGASRIDAVAARILAHHPDIAVVTEFRTVPGQKLAHIMGTNGLTYQASTQPAPRRNGVFVASRLPFIPWHRRRQSSPSPEHWLGVAFEEFDLGAVYYWIPRDRLPQFNTWIDQTLHRHRRRQFVLAGDLNLRETTTPQDDTVGWHEWLIRQGYGDAWRLLHPFAEDYSWTNHNGNRARLDYVFLARPVVPRLVDAFYAHDENLPRVSDHDPLVVDFTELTGVRRTVRRAVSRLKTLVARP